MQFTTGYIKLTELNRPQEIRWTLARLADHFQISSPNLKWSTGRRRGVYLKHDDTILIGPHSWNGLTDTVLHCFAHCLTHKLSTDQDYHGFRFLDNLWQVALLHYEDPKQYAYWSDHTEVREFWRNRLRMWEA